jgi:hypothetical protein
MNGIKKGIVRYQLGNIITAYSVIQREIDGMPRKDDSTMDQGLLHMDLTDGNGTENDYLNDGKGSTMSFYRHTNGKLYQITIRKVIE